MKVSESKGSLEFYLLLVSISMGSIAAINNCIEPRYELITVSLAASPHKVQPASRKKCDSLLKAEQERQRDGPFCM